MSKKPATSTASSLLQLMVLLGRSLSQNLRNSGEDRLEPSHIGILMNLAEGPCSLTELAKRMSVKPPTASRSIDVLVKSGFVVRTIPENNRRLTSLTLSKKGTEQAKLVRKKAETHINSLLKSLTKGEQIEVNAALNILIGALLK